MPVLDYPELSRRAFRHDDEAIPCRRHIVFCRVRVLASATLERRLLSRGWNGWVRSNGKFFLYGSVALTPWSGLAGC